MSDQGLRAAAFPAFKNSIRAHWAPILLEPIAGSYERLVVGIAVSSKDGFHLELANALDRLRCLYSDDAAGAIYAVHLAANHLRRDLASRGLAAILEPNPAISGISIGECRDAEGETLEKIGARWMGSLSSLYSQAISADELPVETAALDGQREAGGDRLPTLVLDYVMARRERLGMHFSKDLRERQRRRMYGRSHEIMIDYSGSHLVANFGTLQATSISQSVHRIKRRLWDLKVERDREHSPILARHHEMIVQAPPADDPQTSKRQQASIAAALQALEEQADQEELRLRSLQTVPQIGDHLLMLEAA